MKCPKCKQQFTPTPTDLATELGRLGKGKAHNLSDAERARRAARMDRVREAKARKNAVLSGNGERKGRGCVLARDDR